MSRVTSIRTHARIVDDVGVDVGENLAQRLVRVGCAGRSGGTGGVDPRNRLAVGTAVAHCPLEQILERAWQCAGVLRRAHEQRVGCGHRRAQFSYGWVNRRPFPIVIQVEVRQAAHPVVQRGLDAIDREGAGRP
jgi:hypothetical protein